jgi:nitroreductase
METINRRRSIRKYTAEPVSPEDIEAILRAAMKAPSARNQQPWHFIVIDERPLLDRIAADYPNAAMLSGAPVAILVCAGLSLVKSEGYWIQDCAAATQNMLLEITDRGLGGVWLGIYPREERVQGLRKLLDIPESVVPFSLVGLGHPDEHRATKDDYRPDRIHRNKW